MTRKKKYPGYAVNVHTWNIENPSITIKGARKYIELKKSILSEVHFELWMEKNGVTEIKEPNENINT